MVTSIGRTQRGPSAQSLMGGVRGLLWTVLGVVLAVATAAIFLATIAYSAAPLFGYKAWVIAGGSMEPTVASGSLVISRHVSPEDLRAGDIITYRPAEARSSVTHRVVDVREVDGHTLFTTKGDANAHADPVEVELLDGANRAEWSVPLAGELVGMARGTSGMLLFLAAPALLLAALWLLDGNEKAEPKKRLEKSEETQARPEAEAR